MLETAWPGTTEPRPEEGGFERLRQLSSNTCRVTQSKRNTSRFPGLQRGSHGCSCWTLGVSPDSGRQWPCDLELPGLRFGEASACVGQPHETVHENGAHSSRHLGRGSEKNSYWYRIDA